jgi:hypothetical protein
MFEAERIAGTDFESNLLIDFIRPPFRKFEFPISLSPEHASKILQHIVEPSTFEWWPSKRHGYFEGTVEGDRFKISRIIRYRNSFLPIIEGTFRRNDGATLLDLKMRMAWPVVVFWSGFILALLWGFVTLDPRQSGFHGTQTTLIGMMLFMYFLATVCFAIEVRIAMRRLLKLLLPGGAR